MGDMAAWREGEPQRRERGLWGKVTGSRQAAPAMLEDGWWLVAAEAQAAGGGNPRPFAGSPRCCPAPSLDVQLRHGGHRVDCAQRVCTGLQGRPWPAQPPLPTVLRLPGESPPPAAVLFILL